MSEFDLYEFPEGHSGRKTYVSVKGHSRSIPKPYTYRGVDGHNYVLPEYGGTWDGIANNATMIMRDVQEFTSPVDGSTISSRSILRDHIRRHDLIEVGNERLKSPRPEIQSNPRETAQAIYHHLDTVRRMPEREYRDRVAQLETRN